MKAVPAVRLFSIQTAPSTAKILHLVRHAEGTHNVADDRGKSPAHIDADLTPRGREQCAELSKVTRDLRVDAVVVSPMTRCLETASLSFPHIYRSDDNVKAAGGGLIPFVAQEEWRETLNFLCDSRRPLAALRSDYPRVDFGNIHREHDPLWSRYEIIHGSHLDHTSLRESDDAASLHRRARAAWGVLHDRTENNLALVGHSAFFQHMFDPLFEELAGVVSYESDEIKELMTGGGFKNCEMRSVAFDAP